MDRIIHILGCWIVILLCILSGSLVTWGIVEVWQHIF